MSPHSKTWLPLDRIESMISLEPALVIVGIAIASWIGYKLLLKDVSEERHKALRKSFKNITGHLIIGAIFFGLYELLWAVVDVESPLLRVASYLGALAMLWGAIVFVKLWRVIVSMYLFFKNMHAAVPLLLVNIFTLLLALLMGAWIATEVFRVQLGPLLATSAVFSLVLGLALQDTLGNLFAGIALQLDKPYEIGDWIEAQNGMQRWVGQVLEITWRATILMGLSDETIVVPNRLMGGAQISNFATRERPFCRIQDFRMDFTTPVSPVKEILAETSLAVPGVLERPAPVVFIANTTESWVTFRLIYYVESYAAQFRITDQVLTQCLAKLEAAGFKPTHNKLIVSKEEA